MRYGKRIKQQWKRWQRIHLQCGHGGYDKVPLKEFARYFATNSSTASRWLLSKQMNLPVL